MKKERPTNSGAPSVSLVPLFSGIPDAKLLNASLLLVFTFFSRILAVSQILYICNFFFSKKQLI